MTTSVQLVNKYQRRHACATCTIPARKNQASVQCCECKVSYFKICPLLKVQNQNYLNKNQKKGTWHCPPCRSKNPKVFCTFCLDEKNVVLLNCSKCQHKYHADCVNRVDLAVKVKGKGKESARPPNWNCSKCEPNLPSPMKNPVTGFDKFLKSKRDGLKILHLNINSLLNKFEKVEELLLKNQIDVFGISETKLVSGDAKKDFEVKGYQLIRRDRPKLHGTRKENRGGGLALYIHKDYTVRVVEKAKNYYKNDYIEYLVVKLSCGNTGVSFSVILVYSPKPNNLKLIGVLSELIADTKKYKPKMKNEVYILGDTNIDLLSELKVAMDLQEMLAERQFLPLVLEPTRVDRHGAKCIDLLATNADRKGIGAKGVVNLNWADHYIVYGFRKAVTLEDSKTEEELELTEPALRRALKFLCFR